MQFSFDGAMWRVRRQAPVTVGARTLTGGPEVESQGSGLWFISDQGGLRFLSIDLFELPPDAAFSELGLAQQVDMLRRATIVRSPAA